MLTHTDVRMLWLQIPFTITQFLVYEFASKAVYKARPLTKPLANPLTKPLTKQPCHTID